MAVYYRSEPDGGVLVSSFNLVPGKTLEHYQQHIAKFKSELLASDLVHSVGPIGRRHAHCVRLADAACLGSCIDLGEARQGLIE